MLAEERNSGANRVLSVLNRCLSHVLTTNMAVMNAGGCATAAIVASGNFVRAHACCG